MGAANCLGMWICHPCLDAPIYRQLGTASRARQPRNPSAHGFAVLLVGTPKFPCQGRFFVKEDERMNEKKEWQSQEQNRNRTLVETEADEEHQPPDIHRVANVLVGADGDECSRSIKNSGCSRPREMKTPAHASTRIAPTTPRIAPGISVAAGKETRKLRSKVRTSRAIQPKKSKKPLM